MNGNGELTIKDLFRKYGRRFAEILKSNDGISTVVIYEIITVKGEMPIIKIKTIDFDPVKKELLISNDDEEEDWAEAFELTTLVDDNMLLSLSVLSSDTNEKKLSSQKIRELGTKVFEYEKALKKLEVFTKKYETLRDEVIEAFISATDTVLE